MEVSLSVLRSHFSLENAREFLDRYVEGLLVEAA
jgi:hypothetical protein